MRTATLRHLSHPSAASALWQNIISVLVLYFSTRRDFACAFYPVPAQWSAALPNACICPTEQEISETESRWKFGSDLVGSTIVWLEYWEPVNIAAHLLWLVNRTYLDQTMRVVSEPYPQVLRVLE